MLDLIVNAMLQRKVIAPVLLDVQELTSVAEYFVICSGSSNRQVAAIAQTIKKELKQQKFKPLSIDGIQEGLWVLMDFGHVVIHIFYDPIRNFYDLEGLWTDAVRVVTPGLEKFEAAMRDEENIDE
ncbi:MAG: ribosome silencing factor [Desulfobacterales bacterium]|nr:ribosome silencing factor [Desulfobacterales bacterium]